ncbi:rhomboid family intramembrane serine protease [Dysgonomonas sp. 521]|uniref:rhomboid family intramembrane serine protease n=1 Tax=Dysgonomonas sp. 521 TaxID=2302932 RepID=UPI0013D5E966|nr:rhomboid family intramembrane serine protease [Dysgonomonas sp. 521]NDV94926.1 rhomboid family intramembrane serine protease [Dysgonomonas sp. 521]
MKESVKRIKDSLEYALSIALVLWIIHIVQWLFHLNLASLGVYPRSLDGALGIVTSPFIHGDFQHLIANTVPFIVLTALTFFFYKKKAVVIYLLIWFTSGLLTWIIGRSAWHIGASSVIYGLASFLIFGGLFSKNFKLIAVSVIVLLLYSGLVWGIFPGDGGVSWEGHLSGAISGLIWAYSFRKSLERI